MKIANEHQFCNRLAIDVCRKHKLKISHFMFEHTENDSHWRVLYDDNVNIRECVQACCKYSAIFSAISNHFGAK